MQHEWKPNERMFGSYISLCGQTNALVRVKKSPNGRYMWQFRKIVSYADTIEQAKEYVEAGAEFFDVMRRNPY